MLKKIDRYIFLRLLTITVFVLSVLIFIYVVIHYSDNNEDFIDKGATMAEIFGVYYLNYIPEMTRLVLPLAVFVATLYLTSQMTDRLEIIALKAAGVSLYRLLLPYMAFAILTTGLLSYLDSYVIPKANEKRIAFEKQYLQKNTRRLDKSKIYRQESENRIFKINYFNANEKIAYQVDVISFAGDSVDQLFTAQRMIWLEERQQWRMLNTLSKKFRPMGIRQTRADTIDTTLNILPRDLARRTSDIYQLTYPEAFEYINSLQRSGAIGIERPQTDLFGRMAYPFSIVIVCLVGFSLASERRRGGKGFHIAAGAVFSFLYIALIEIIKTFGREGTMDPIVATMIPHTLFLVLGIGLLIKARK